jgi:hypothetical protein
MIVANDNYNQCRVAIKEKFALPAPAGKVNECSKPGVPAAVAYRTTGAV